MHRDNAFMFHTYAQLVHTFHESEVEEEEKGKRKEAKRSVRIYRIMLSV